ncbi:MAG: membrane protein insertion efficiency factor YidD [Candidatus Sericytochromatia bacterium]|nr:membrane protein insertion efficiency factor YidD [Candidatus Sericytochromatia bacterium]
MNPERWVLRVVLVLLRGYKLLISPWLPPACRFWPTCSEYAHEAVVRHGVRKGVWLGVKRLARCHPWGPHGPDPVP